MEQININLIVGLFMIILILFVSWYMIQHQRQKNFNRFLKEGDTVDWYIENEKKSFTILKHGGIFSTIKDHNGFHYEVLTDSLEPTHGFKYKI